MVKVVLEHPLFKDSTRLQACLKQDSQNVKLNDTGDHVVLIQKALAVVFKKMTIDPAEIASKKYGTSTRDVVLEYKRDRKIINSNYQTAADAIVGKMTIAHLDDELLGRPKPKDPLTDPEEPERIRALLTRERPAVQPLIQRSLDILREIETAILLQHEEPGRIMRLMLERPLAFDALNRFCGMGFRPDRSIVGDLIVQYEGFKLKVPQLSSDQEAISFADFSARFPGNVEPGPDGPNFPPAVSDAPNKMFFTPHYRDFDPSQRAGMQGMFPIILQLTQLHEMGHFYFGFDDGDPRGKPFSVTRKFAQTYELFTRQAVAGVKAA